MTIDKYFFDPKDERFKLFEHGQIFTQNFLNELGEEE